MTAIYGKRNISVPMERPVAKDSFLTAKYLGVSRSSVIRSALQAWIDQTAGQRADVSEVPLPKRPRQKRSDPNSKQLRGAKVLPPRPMVTSFTADFDFVQDVRRASKLTGVPISIYVETALGVWIENHRPQVSAFLKSNPDQEKEWIEAEADRHVPKMGGTPRA